ncbi:MAG: glycosyltransferase family 2 protein, partial [Candidatus Omnitrophica bacterium]|nr:glycosyltransferase family 2 protein [Candidatus Omnitrophota bacterium]
MDENFLITVVVVDWKGNTLLKNCLEALYAQSYKNFEVILIENEPPDDFLKSIKEAFPQIKIIVNKKNLFYASSQNQGIKEANGEFILSLNNDVILDKNFLREAVRSMQDDGEIGIVSGKLLSFDGKIIDSAGQCLSRSRRPLERGYGEKDTGKFDKPGFVFGACGACALYRKKMLEEIKIKDGEYFDGDYGLFYEDLDLNWRAKRFGWKAYYNPKAVAYHLRSGSTKMIKPQWGLLGRYRFCSLSSEHKLMLLKNRYATIIKNENLQSFLKNLSSIFVYDFFLWIYILF